MRIGKTLMAVAMVGVSFAAVAKPAHAQLGTTFVGVGEFDTDNNYLALAGVSVSPRRPGWSWIAGVSGYWLQYPTGTDTHKNVTGITPTVGLKNSFNGGSFSARVGYTFTGSSSSLGVPIFSSEGGGKGVVNTAQLDYWGSGAVSAQAIGSYNYGSESFWGRGRLGARIARWNDGAVTIGPEVAYLSGDGYSFTRIGGVLGLNPGPGTGINLAIGRKLAGEGTASDATYFTAELVLFPH